jgi:hypothetical protein
MVQIQDGFFEYKKESFKTDTFSSGAMRNPEKGQNE